MSTSTLTIGKLARAAGVGVETVRYYQQRELLPVPEARGAFRYYPGAAVERIRFIKRAQELGFTLDEIAELLRLQDRTDRAQVRQLAAAKATQIAQKLSDLDRMHRVLLELVDACTHTAGDHPCPIIESLSHDAHRTTHALDPG
jgi:MerR family mercuric resistance operon transcriptional regulator